MANDDLTMESTTDSPEQIAEGLGVELPVEAAEEAVEAAAEGDDATESGEESAEAVAEEPVGEVTPEPAKVIAAKPRAVAKPKKLVPRSVNGAIAAVRREEEAKRRVAETERDAALARVKELTAGVPQERPAAVRAAAAEAITPESVPDTHPQVASLLGKITALGAKPKQADFADFEEFEEKRDTWIEERARLRARVDSVREDVARRETLARDDANRAAAQVASAFEKAEATARTRHADYDEKLASAKTAGLRVSDDVTTAILESPHGGELRYYLCANPAEVTRINALSPHRQVVELGLIEGRIAASLTGEPAATRRATRVTHAPDPQENLLGDLGGPASFKSAEAEMNDPRTTQARYNQLRNQMDVASGRRTH